MISAIVKPFNTHYFLLASLLLVTCYFTLITFFSSVHAQSCPIDQNTKFSSQAQQMRNCAVDRDLTSIASSLSNMLISEKGAAVGMSKMVSALYGAPPISGVHFISTEIQKLNPVQPAYAQEGIGFDALTPVQRVWTVFRNTAYVGFVIVFVIIGFMIMFRAHISPQAVATVQDSLPRIVIALILVTFSYAIAGLMIDLMFVLLNVAISILAFAGLTPETSNIIFQKSIFGIVFGSFHDIFESVSSAVAEIFSQIIPDSGGALHDIIDYTAGNVAGFVVGIIAGAAMLFVMFRIFIMLLMAYVQIILLTMFAPFFFLIQSLPGNNGARAWFAQMAANTSVFLSVAVMILLAGLLGGLPSLGGSGASEFTQGQIGQFPLLSGVIEVNAIGKLIAFGFILMTPEAAKLVKHFLQVKEFGLGASAGATLASGAGLAGRVSLVQPAANMAQGISRQIGVEKQEQFAARIPHFGAGIKKRRAFYGIKDEA